MYISAFFKRLILKTKWFNGFRFILRDRRAELDSRWKKGKAEKNGFRRTCIAQEYTRLKKKYDELSEYI